jgi:hypothetical protein
MRCKEQINSNSNFIANFNFSNLAQKQSAEPKATRDLNVNYNASASQLKPTASLLLPQGNQSQ